MSKGNDLFMSTGSSFVKTGFNAMLNLAFKGTPDYLPPTQFKIGTGTTTPADTDTDVETVISAWYSGTDFKDYVSGYPTFNTVDQKVTFQGFIASTEANSNTITEYADFNADGSPVMFTHSVFTGITKTSAVQIYITTILKRS